MRSWSAMRSGVGGLLALCACHGTDALPAPPLEGASSVVLGFVVGGQLSRLFAFEVTDGTVDGLPNFGLDRPIELYAVTMGCSLRALGIERGLQDLSVEPTQLPPALGKGFRLSVGGGGGAWAPVDPLPEVMQQGLRRLDVRTEDRCRLLAAQLERVTTETINSTTAIRLAVVADDRRALLATEAGVYYEVNSDAPLRVRSDLPDTLPRAGGVRAADGELWLVERRGALAHGPIEGPFERLPDTVVTATAALEHLSLAASQGDAPFEIFLVSDRGNFERFDGQSWALLTWDENVAGEPDVVWLGPGHAVALVGDQLSGYELTVWRDGGLSREVIPVELGRPSGLGVVPDIGFVVGTFFERIAIPASAGGWELFAPPESSDLARGGLGIRDFVPFGEGFIWGRAGMLTSWFLQYQPGAGFCGLDPVTKRTVEHILPMTPDRTLLVDRSMDDLREVTISILERRFVATCNAN